jgi:hypothetical protein
LVGDPKQAIYRFRGADIKAYNEARASIAAQADGAVVAITANFRSQGQIIDHVNQCFEPVLRSEGQPGYVHLTATIDRAEHGLPCAAKVTIGLPNDPLADTQRDEEAAIVARICRNLIGAIQVNRADGSVVTALPEVAVQHDIPDSLNLMSAFGGFCCKSQLRRSANRDSVVLTRIAARSIHDGPSEE